MIGERENFKIWFNRLACAEAGQRDDVQVPALLEAFKAIEDAVVREEILILIEMIARNPCLLHRVALAAKSAMN